jgi:DNA modification methylase
MINANVEVQEFLKTLTNMQNLHSLTTNTDNKKAPVHRWFPFLAGFSHQLVQEVVHYFKLPESDKLLFDPFMGSGTTGVVGREFGVNVVGNEVNPLLYKICQIKLNPWKAENSASLRSSMERILKISSESWSTVNTDEEQSLLKKCYPIDNLKKLVGLRNLIETEDFLTELDKLYLFLALNKCLVHCAQVGINVPYVSWSSKKEPQEALSSFRIASEVISEDLTTMSGMKSRRTLAEVFPDDSRAKHSKLDKENVDMVFTSPPYLNNFDYGESLRVFLYFWRIANNWDEINERIRKVAVTSSTTHYSTTMLRSESYEKILGAEFIKKSPRISEDLITKAENMKHEMEIRKNPRKSFDLLTLLYFKDMFQVLKEIHRLTKKGGLCFFVLGDSAPYGVYVPTDNCLGEIGLNLGFSSFALQPLRKRGVKWQTLKNRHNQILREGLLILRR